jgi:hypothetical protein
MYSLSHADLWIAVVTDWNYEVTAKRVGWPTDRVGDSSSDFPFEKARARLAWLFLAAQCICALGYGWAVHYQVVSYSVAG